MKKIISVITCLSILFTAFTYVFAGEVDTSIKTTLTKGELIKKVEELNVIFPGAELDYEDYVIFQERIDSMSSEERLSYYASLTERDDFETYQSYDGNSTLRIYTAGATSVYGSILGSYTDHGTYDSYVGTKVFLDQLWGYININAHYYVNHDYINATGMGVVRYRGDFSFTAYVHYIIVTYILLNSMFVSPIGSSQAVLQTELTTVDLGPNSEPAYIETIKLIYDATNFSTFLWEGPSH